MQPCDGFTPDPPVLPSVEIPWYGNPSIWFWIAVIVALAAVEWWAWKAHRQTPSQWLRKQAGKFRWLQIFGTGLFAYLIWHFFYSEQRYPHRSQSTNGQTGSVGEPPL